MVYLPKAYKNLYPAAKPSAPKRNKYGARKVVIDGIKFDSIAEGDRYRQLKTMEHAGLISALELQPEFVLQDKYRHQGRAVRAIKYRADFRYLDQDGTAIVEDVKGKKTAVYQLKKKMLLRRYPDINFREVFTR
jgi:hypothetical protein